MSAKVGVIANNQPVTAKPRAHLQRVDADFLVAHFFAERISQKLIRQLHSGSVFGCLGMLRMRTDVPVELPRVELPGVRYREPISAEWREAHLLHQAERRLADIQLGL